MTRSCDTCDLDGADDELREAAIEFAETDAQLGMYADEDKRMTPDKVECREHTRANLRAAALRYAIAELETEFGDQRIPPGHVGDEPSVFDALEHLKRQAGP